MSNMDVSLRLRLVNQLSRPAEEAERDLKDLRKAAEQLGRTKGGDALAKGLIDVGKNADAAKAKLSEVEKEANQVRQAISRTGSGFNDFKADAAKAETSLAQIKDKADSTRLAIARIGEGFGNFKGDAASAEGALAGIEQQAVQAKAAIGRIDDGAFASLKGDAASAEAAIKQIGAAADSTAAKLKQLHTPAGTGAPYRPGVQPAARGGMFAAVEGAVDQFGMPIAIGAGGAYLAGAVPAGVAVAGVASVKAAANDEQRSDALRVTGEYDAAEQRRIDAILGRAGAVYGVGTAKAQETFGTLISNGVDAKDAATMTEGVIKVGKATNADPVDVAGTTVSMREIMGLNPSEMPAGYESIAVGGKMGKFEVRDMAQHGPSLFAAMAGQGSTGLRGVRLTSAMVQSIAREAGSNDQAKTSYEAMLTDMVSPDVAGRFQEDYGQNIYEIRKKAIAEGKDPVLESLRAYQKAVQGDEEKTRGLFRNSEAYKGYNAVFKDLDLIIKRMEQMENAGGVIDSDYRTNTDNLNSQLDRLSTNVGYNIKNTAAPILPSLTTVVETLASTLERIRENEQTNPLLNAPVAGEMNWLVRMLTDKGGNGRPSAWKQFLLGDAANPDFNARDHFAIGRGAIPVPTPRPERPDDLGRSTGQIPIPTTRPQELSSAASEAMGAYTKALANEGEKAKAEASSIADYIKSILNFSVSPTIAPTFVAPSSGGASAPASEKHSSLQNSSSMNLTQNIVTPNPKLAALKARRDQARAIQQAKARSLHDIGRGLA